jgi:hypothetical protein
MEMKDLAMTEYTYDERLVSDLHKDVYGSRPKEGFWMHWNLSTHDEKQELWNGLLRLLDLAFENEKKERAMNIANFEHRVLETIRYGAGDRVTAIRWILDTEDLLDEPDKCFVRYKLGLPYDYDYDAGVCL